MDQPSGTQDGSTQSQVQFTSNLNRLFHEGALKRLSENYNFSLLFGDTFGEDLGLWEAIPGSATPAYNCLAWCLDITDTWVDPGTSENGNRVLFMDRNQNPQAPTITREFRSRKYTPENTLTPLGGLPYHGIAPEGWTRIRVYYAYGARGENIHFMRQESNGTWSSKNGGWLRFENIHNPDLFYRYFYFVDGNFKSRDFIVKN